MLWTPAFAGVTRLRLFTSPSYLTSTPRVWQDRLPDNQGPVTIGVAIISGKGNKIKPKFKTSRDG